MKIILLLTGLLSCLYLPAQTKSKLLQQAEQLQKEQPQLSISYAEKSLNEAIQNNDHYNASLSGSLLARMHAANGVNLQVLQYDSLAAIHAGFAGNKDFRIDTYSDYANDLMMMNFLADAGTWLNKAALLLDTTASARLVRWYKIKGLMAFKSFKIDSSLAAYQKAFSIAVQLGDENESIKSKMLVGQLWLYKGKTDSMHLVYEALEYFERRKDNENAFSAAMIIGFGFQTAYKMDDALAYYARAKNYALAMHSNPAIAEVNQRTGDVYLAQKKYDEALQLFRQSQSIYEQSGNTQALAVVKVYLGRLYTQTNEYDKAKQQFDEATELNKAMKSPTVSLAINGYRMMLANKMKDYKATDSLAAIAVTAGSKMFDKDLQKMAVNKLVSANTVSKKQQDSLLKTFSSIKTLKEASADMQSVDFDMERLNVYTGGDVSQDSNVIASATKQLTELETKYQTRIIKDSLHIQQQQAEIAKQEVSRRNTIIIVSFICLLLLVAGLYLQYKYRKKAERDSEEIRLLKDEIHHRVNNNLAVVNRFIEIAGKNAPDKEPFTALQNRITSIELIHHYLYGESAKPGHLSLQPYLQELCEAIATTFGDPPHITVTVSAGIELANAIAEKIGLIVNELVTNSYKYAFGKRAAGNIKVQARRLTAEQVEFIICDDGIGFNPETIKYNYGMKLIRGLSQQLKGSFVFENKEGAYFRLVIPA